MTSRTPHWFFEHLWKRWFDPQEQILSVQFDITNACNLRCDHCYCPHHKNDGALDYREWCAVLDQYEQLLHTLHMEPNITLCGGEPLVAPFLEAFLREIRRRFPTGDVSIQTNGTLITEMLARELSELSVSVQISVDGPDAKRHDSIRGNGSFSKTMKGCSLLRRHNVPYHFQAVLSQRSEPWIADFFKMAQAQKAQAMDFARLVVEGHASGLVASHRDEPLTGIHLKDALTEILFQSRKYQVPTRTLGPLWHLIEPTLGSPDNTGFASFVIDYRGNFKVTSRTPFVLGNVFDKGGLERIFFNHPVMQKLRHDKIDGCGSCSYFQQCRGDRNASFATHGHFFGPGTGCWVWLERTKGLSITSLQKRGGSYDQIVQDTAAANVGSSPT